MSETVGQIDLGLNINQKSFNKQLSGIASGAQKSVMSAFGGIGKMVGVALGVKAVVGFGKSCLELGSNLSEVQNVVDVTFGSMSSEINQFASTAITQFGLSETAAKKYAGVFGAMSKSMGLSQQAALEMAKTVTGLTGDVASFYNLSNDEAYTKLKSIWTGETETLKDLGVVMTQTNLKQYALQNGYSKSIEKMTEAEKVTLRYNYVLDALKDTQGDFARTSDSWANQTRILSEQFNALKATVGQGLIVAFTPVVKWLNIIVSKLRIAAGYFKAFMELIFGKQADSGGAVMQEVADSTGGIADSAGTASDAVEGVGDAAKKAGKKAKGALANFDELNQLNLSKDTSSDTGAGGVGSAIGGAIDVDFGQIDTSTNVLSDKVTSMIDGIIQEFKRLKDIFKTGFEIGIGGDWKERLEELQSFVPRIKESLKNIFDSDTLQSARNMFDAWILSAGQTVGAWTSVGITIMTNLIGGITKYLEQNGQYIKERLVGIFNVSEEIAVILGNLVTALADIFSVSGGETAQQITANIIGIFSNAFLGVTELALLWGKDLLNCITQPILDNKEKIKETLENLFQPLESVTGTIKDLVTNTFSKVLEAYRTYIEPAYKNIQEGLSQLLSTCLDVFNNNIIPVLDNVAVKFKEMYEQYLQPAIDSAIECFGKLFKAGSEVYKKCIVPLCEYVIKTLGPSFQLVFNTIVSVVQTAASWILDSLKLVLDNLGLLIDFVTNVFSGDWEEAFHNIGQMFDNFKQSIDDKISLLQNLFKDLIGYIGTYFKQQWEFAWNNMKNIFSNICGTFEGVFKEPLEKGLNWLKSTFIGGWSNAWNSISNTFTSIWDDMKNGAKKAINGIIGFLNKMINGINSKLSFELPEFFGGGHVGFSIPNVPKLARGGIVDQPTLAMVGEAGKEAVVPLENNTEWVSKVAMLIASALAPLIGGNGSGSSEVNRDIVLQIGDVELVRAFLPTLLKEAKRQGVVFPT